ncbi:MAG: carboxypeptidase-like regulatory domain-containing protein [Ignavibacteriales bacterium]|nr:carboxypeptidase-like regulatory domain-containing protein [Ignavibacteriales bacterium]
MNRTAYILTLLLIAACGAYTQTADWGALQGRVVDAKTGEALPGANVTIKGTYYGGTSGIDGTFKVDRIFPENIPSTSPSSATRPRSTQASRSPPDRSPGSRRSWKRRSFSSTRTSSW